ncbi:MAG: nuclear transport factor 2 family protein [Acidimicrobiales bacterium]
MNGSLMLGIATLVGSVWVTAATRETADEQAIRRTVQYYFDGGRNADSATMRKAFRLDVAHMLFVREGQLVDVPIPEFVRRTGARRTADFQPDSFPRRVTLVDVAGTSAVAKLEMVTPVGLVVDYMALLKIDGEWLIVNKIFDRVQR